MTGLDLDFRFAGDADAGPRFAPAAADVLVIEPRHGWCLIDFSELWRCRVRLRQALDCSVRKTSLLAALILLRIGVVSFRRTERRFADIA